MKKGNYYEIKEHIINNLEMYSSENYPFGYIYISLDSESIHLQSSVHHILEVLGTIGGSFELVHYIIFIIYSTFRKNLYFHSMIKGISDFQKFQNQVGIKIHKNRREICRINEQVKEMPKRVRNFDEQDESKHEIVLNNQTPKREQIINKVIQSYLRKQENSAQIRK